jgi:hypothetical protein
LRPTSPLIRLEPAPSARPFIASPESPDARLVVGWRELESTPPGELVFDSGGSWRLFRRGDLDVYRFFDGTLGPTPYKEAELHPGGRDGRVWLDPRFHAADQPVDPLQFPLDELLFLRLLGVRGGVELHACGLVAPSGQGLVFAGQSGDGKTTTARLWEGVPEATVLSDDRVVVRRDDTGLWVYGTPWHGDAGFAVSARAPLAAVFVLGRGDRDAIEPLGSSEALSLLLARSFPPFHDAAGMSRTLDSLEAVVASVPCARFSFVPGAGAVRSVLEWLSSDAGAPPAVR